MTNLTIMIIVACGACFFLGLAAGMLCGEWKK